MSRMAVPSNDDLMTTGEVALTLGVTRQHVRNLCDRGLLPVIHVGSHRRIRRIDLEEFCQSQRTITRDQLRNLWLHQAVAGKLVMRPEPVLNLARRNLERLREQHPRGVIANQFDEWARLLDGPMHELLHALTSLSPHAIELRQNSPFAGALTERERMKVLASFKTNERQSA